ncbi:MAG: hypothetical protein ACQESE_04460 [Nanobdellota archaeon]
MKPIIAVDLNGALIHARPFRTVHHKWFLLFASLLDRPALEDMAGAPDYMVYVDDIMDDYLGPVSEVSKKYFARQLFGMMLVAEAKPDDVVKEFAEYLCELKSSFRLALITTAPAPAVIPLLEKIGYEDIFDIIYKSSPGSSPDKIRLFKRFVSEFDTPQFYIGRGDRDLDEIKALGISTLSVTWVEDGGYEGDHTFVSVNDLKSFFENDA